MVYYTVAATMVDFLTEDYPVNLPPQLWRRGFRLRVVQGLPRFATNRVLAP